MTPTKAVASVTFPILLARLIHLNLGELLLQTALYRLAFLQGEAEVVETRSVDTAVDDCNLPTLPNAIGPDNLNPDLHPQSCHPRVPFPEKASIT
jgi:hypothetical protein